MAEKASKKSAKAAIHRAAGPPARGRREREAAYRQTAGKESREAEAAEWVDGTFGDISDETQ